MGLAVDGPPILPPVIRLRQSPSPGDIPIDLKTGPFPSRLFGVLTDGGKMPPLLRWRRVSVAAGAIRWRCEI